MQEILRLHYLHAMGINSYLPRKALPGALASPICAWPVGLPCFDDYSPTPAPAVHPKAGSTPPEVGQRAAQANSASNTASDQALLARLQQDLAGAGPGLKKTAKAALGTAGSLPSPVASRTAATGEWIQCQWTFFAPRQDLLVLVPAAHLAKEHEHLLKNILLALGIKRVELVPLDNFRWPPAAGRAPQLNSELAGVQETLHALLQGHQLKHPFKHLLVFESGLGKRLFPEPALHGAAVWLLPSLQDMLTEPLNKKNCWQSIRHLAL